MIKFLSDSDAMVAPALRVLGNMSTGNDELTQVRGSEIVVLNEFPYIQLENIDIHEVRDTFFEDGFFQCVVDLNTLDEILPLSERSKSTTVVKECCWLISNIIAGTNSQIQAVIDAGIMPFIIEVLRAVSYFAPP